MTEKSMVRKELKDLKTKANIFKDDDWETTPTILKSITSLLKDNSLIYDPFYCEGRIINSWEELGFKCINEKKDAFNREHPENFDYLISNIPFSCKEKCVKLGLELDKPFMLLMPVAVLCSAWITKYFEKIQIAVPSRRYNFSKQGEVKKGGAWFDCCWVCYKMDLPTKIVKLE